ncbi:CBS domain-containing protein [Amycolatopsis alkalitolerans]|uniref:CBS domain-containing protein n=1 Tax=Amycolatopsis alkalitolerans TaxID=2547244 RepID=A0A5C4LVV2_9PSEU|nr:CBS domain-containing protein [Amycolatopsis alkalitolerans]TNC20469.1 CBS domain-containing protein [Amycolatopsis alkalitolerans]
MRAWEIMSKPVVRVGPSTPVPDATALLVQYGFAALPVVDADQRVVGIFTEADALRASGTGGEGSRVAAYMTAPADVVSTETDVARIARQMLDDRRRCIPVVEDGVLVGVVSRRDVLRPLFRRDETVTADLRSLLATYLHRTSEWEVEVSDGVATVSGEFAGDAERNLIGILARTVPGVVRAEIRETASPATKGAVDEGQGG